MNITTVKNLKYVIKYKIIQNIKYHHCSSNQGHQISFAQNHAFLTVLILADVERPKDRTIFIANDTSNVSNKLSSGNLT